MLNGKNVNVMLESAVYDSFSILQYVLKQKVQFTLTSFLRLKIWLSMPWTMWRLGDMLTGKYDTSCA